MQLMQGRGGGNGGPSGSGDVVVTSSLDKTVKIWDASRLLEAVPEVDSMELRVEKLILCESSGAVVSVTRGAVGIWNLGTGGLDATVGERPQGGCVIDVAISPGGRYFATAELDLVQIWNLPTRVVLFRDSQEDLVQLERVECPPGPGLVVAFSCNQFSDREDESDGKRNVTCSAIARAFNSGATAYSFQCPVREWHRAVVTGDGQFFCILGWDGARSRRNVTVVHSRRGVVLHKIPVKQHGLRQPQGFSAVSEACVAVVDGEKGSLYDVRNKVFLRSVKGWTGEATADGRFGLSSNPSGGLLYLDLRTGQAEKCLVEKKSEGIFKVLAGFTACEEYIYYYQSNKRTLRLFRRSDGKMSANFCLNSEAAAVSSTLRAEGGGLRLIVGGSDGSVTMLVVAADPSRSRALLRGLHSRRVVGEGERGSGGGGTQPIGLVREIRKDPIIRFRAIARAAHHMDKVLRNYKAAKKDPFKNPSCLLS